MAGPLESGSEPCRHRYHHRQRGYGACSFSRPDNKAEKKKHNQRAEASENERERRERAGTKQSVDEHADEQAELFGQARAEASRMPFLPNCVLARSRSLPQRFRNCLADLDRFCFSTHIARARSVD